MNVLLVFAITSLALFIGFWTYIRYQRRINERNLNWYNVVWKVLLLLLTIFTLVWMIVVIIYNFASN